MFAYNSSTHQEIGEKIMSKALKSGNYKTNGIFSSPHRSIFVHTSKRSDTLSEEEIKALINKANDYMKLKPWRPKSAVAKYIGVTVPCLVRWSKEGRIELPLPRRNIGGEKGLKLIPLYKELKSSWGNV